MRAALAALLMLVAVTPVFAEAGCFEGCVSASQTVEDKAELVSITAAKASPGDDDQNRAPQPVPCSFGHGVHVAGLPAPPVQDVECRTVNDKHLPSLASPLVAAEPDRRERPPQA